VEGAAAASALSMVTWNLLFVVVVTRALGLSMGRRRTVG
jgi:hypothetical protein